MEIWIFFYQEICLSLIYCFVSTDKVLKFLRCVNFRQCDPYSSDIGRCPSTAAQIYTWLRDTSSGTTEAWLGRVSLRILVLDIDFAIAPVIKRSSLKICRKDHNINLIFWVFFVFVATILMFIRVMRVIYYHYVKQLVNVYY